MSCCRRPRRTAARSSTRPPASAGSRPGRSKPFASSSTVEANLTRSKDRLDGLDAQLRTLRMQAAKAQKYKEYSDRLRELRVGLGVARVPRTHRGAGRRAARPRGTASRSGGREPQTGELEQSLRELDWEVTRAEDGLRHQEGRLADARQQIAGFDATLKHERAAAAEHETELLKIGRQRVELGYRTKVIEADAARAAADAVRGRGATGDRAASRGCGRRGAGGGRGPRRPSSTAMWPATASASSSSSAMRPRRARPRPRASRRSSGFRRNTRGSSRRSNSRPRAVRRWPKPSTGYRARMQTCRLD